MERTVYVNGEFVSESNASISVFDRGFLFSDGVYEVTSVVHGKLIDNTAHLARLKRSMDELGLVSPIAVSDIPVLQQELVARNALQEGLLYLQVTRGTADRDFAYPKIMRPSLVMFTQKKPLLNDPKHQCGLRVITTPDLRWRRRDIKTVGLLAASMAKQTALDAGADDAWMLEDGHITEASSSNAYIINNHQTIITRHLSHAILAGITRSAVLRLAAEHQLSIEERPFTVDEVLQASEAFSTSASSFVMPVVSIDGKPIADGKPGTMTKHLHQIYIKMVVDGTP